MKRIILTTILTVALSSTAWAGGYGHRSHHGHGGDYRGSDVGVALLGGLLFGGLIGYAINEDRHRTYAAPYYPPPQPAYAPAPAAAYPAPASPAPVYNAPAPPANYTVANSEFGVECIMTREYTTTVHFEGRAHEAYGTRCMRPDGSWLLGAPYLAPPR